MAQTGELHSLNVSARGTRLPESETVRIRQVYAARACDGDRRRRGYDAIHRVPFVWSWPGPFGKGSVKTGLVETVDVFPTICACLGIPVPTCVQGRDLSGLLTSDADSGRDAVFFEYLDAKTVRTKDCKLSYGLAGTREIGELFDLRIDPHTYNNLFDQPGAGAMREVMLRKLLDWWISTQQPPNFSPTDEELPPSRWFQGHGRMVE